MGKILGEIYVLVTIHFHFFLQIVPTDDKIVESVKGSEVLKDIQDCMFQFIL